MEEQCAANADVGAIQFCAILECEDLGGGVVSKRVGRAVDLDVSRMRRAVVLPKE